jgi:hypothetical protein
MAGCGSARHLEVHHRVPLVLGGSDDVENLLALCRGCHRWVHEKLTHDIAMAYSEKFPQGNSEPARRHDDNDTSFTAVGVPLMIDGDTRPSTATANDRRRQRTIDGNSERSTPTAKDRGQMSEGRAKWMRSAPR